ncbi:MAG: XRE family transcriptional regulator [Eubacteriales bacterium]
MSIGKRIRARRKALGMTLEALGRAAGTSKQTVQRYESGIISNIPADKVEAMALALGTTPSALMGWEEQPGGGYLPVSRKKVPVLGRIACGEPLYAEAEYGHYVTADGELDVDFCLRAQGDSMTGARIFDGDLVFVKRQEAVDNGEVAVVLIDGESTLKRVYYYPRQQKLVLAPENHRYPPLVFVGKELEQIRILGRAVAFQSTVR